MTEVLYRKYRPKDFEEIFGQEQVTNVLKNAIRQNRIAHAYLFSGPRGTGKTSIARIFARAVNCAVLNRSQNERLPKRAFTIEPNGSGGISIPCNSCDICKEFLSGHTLDLVEIDAASNRGIDEVRALKEGALTVPFLSTYKVYIIDEVHMMTKEAFNALLKILEEPPKHVIFILATTETDKVPETISSRTQHLHFHALSEPIVARAIEAISKKEGIVIDKEAVSLLAFLSEGSLRDALNLLLQAQNNLHNRIEIEAIRDTFGVPSRELVEQLMDGIFAKDNSRIFAALAKVSESHVSPQVFLKMLLRNFRFLFLIAHQPAFAENLKRVTGEEEYEYIVSKKDIFRPDELRQILATLLYTATARYTSPYPSLPLELAVSKILSLLSK